MELARLDSTRKLLGNETIKVPEADEDVVKQCNVMRFSSAP